MNFSVIIPCYNELNNLKILIPDILSSLNSLKYEIIIVDDFSNDGTQQYFSKHIIKNLKVCRNEFRSGQSRSITNGIKQAKHEYIITLDGDCQNDPKDIIKLINILKSDNEISLVGGLRKKRRDNFWKILSSKFANSIRKKILKDNCDDTGCALKIFRKEIFLTFPFFDGMHRFLPALFLGFGGKTKYVPVNHTPRMYGSSNYGTLYRAIDGLIKIYKVKKIIKNYRAGHYD